MGGSSSTETENETNQRPVLQERKKKAKNQLKKERDNAKFMRKNKKGKKLHLNLSALRTNERIRKDKLHTNAMKKVCIVGVDETKTLGTSAKKRYI